MGRGVPRRASTAGYAAGSRYLATHGGIADMCILGEPTEQRVVLGHYGAMWARISTHGPFIHTAFSAGPAARRTRSCACASVLDDVLAWIPRVGASAAATAALDGVVNVGSLRGGAAVAGQPHAGPHRPVPRHPRAADDGDAATPRTRFAELVRGAARAPPRRRDRVRGLRDRAGRRDRRGPSADRRDRRRTRARCSARRPSATSCAGSRTPRR